MSLIITGTKSKVRELKEANCWGFTFHTSEIDSSQLEKLRSFDYCKLLLTDDNINDPIKELIENQPLNSTEKYSKSQIFRFNVNEIKEGEEFYNQVMNALIFMAKQYPQRILKLVEFHDSKNGN